MRIYTRVVLDIATGQIIEQNFFDYVGPLALADNGDGDGDDSGDASGDGGESGGGDEAGSGSEAGGSQSDESGSFEGSASDFGTESFGDIADVSPEASEAGVAETDISAFEAALAEFEAPLEELSFSDITFGTVPEQESSPEPGIFSTITNALAAFFGHPVTQAALSVGLGFAPGPIGFAARGALSVGKAAAQAGMFSGFTSTPSAPATAPSPGTVAGVVGPSPGSVAPAAAAQTFSEQTSPVSFTEAPAKDEAISVSGGEKATDLFKVSLTPRPELLAPAQQTATGRRLPTIVRVITPVYSPPPPPSAPPGGFVQSAFTNFFSGSPETGRASVPSRSAPSGTGFSYSKGTLRW